HRAEDVADDLAVAAGADDDDTAHSAHAHAMPTGPRLPVNGVMLAWPSCEIPSRARTRPRVFAKMRRSSPRLQLSTYQTSSENFSSQVSALRPLTCAQPVMPGSTS